MIVPYSTDAPISYWPFATVGLIIANVVIFCATLALPSRHGGNDDAIAAVLQEAPPVKVQPSFAREDLELAAGQGVHPIQWLTCNFMHGNVFHLLGNLIFLWSFGIIVEGKLGWWKFLLVYLGIGVANGAGIQFLLLGARPSSALGASAIIYGLMAMALVWAPVNELTCLVFFRIIPWTVEIPVLWFAGFYITLEAFFATLSGFQMSSALGHFSGAIWGAGIAIWLLKSNLVDCENWDIFAVIENRKGRSAQEAQRERKQRKTYVTQERRVKTVRPIEASAKASSSTPEERSASALRRVRKRLDSGDLEGAVAAYEKHAKALPDWPGEAQLIDLIKRLHAEKAVLESVPLMRDYCRRFTEHGHKLRLRYAMVLTRDLRRPTAALRVLSEIPAGALDANLEQVRHQVATEAQQMVDEGELELEET